MAVNQIQPGDINARLASFGQTLNSLMLLQIPQFANTVVAIGVAGLQAAPYNYSSADATNIFNACQDLNHFAQVYQGLWYVTFGTTLNSGVPTANSAGHFGYPFNLTLGLLDGFGA